MSDNLFGVVALTILFVLFDQPITLSLYFLVAPFLYRFFFDFPREFYKVFRLIDASFLQVCHTRIHLHECTPTGHSAKGSFALAVSVNDCLYLPPFESAKKRFTIKSYFAHYQRIDGVGTY